MQTSALNVLDALEEAELKSISWGYPHGAFTYSEIERILKENELGSVDLYARLKELVKQKLIFRFEDGTSEEKYRTRFSELVRLLTSNRQQFPNRNWQAAPQLVVDYRVDRRKRAFPKRNISLESLNKISPLSEDDFGKQILKHLLYDEDSKSHFKLAGFQKRSLERVLSSTEESGTVVTAGTGSGKTLSFYLPVLIELSKLIDNRSWTKALAVYPRTELLKDQFMEAYQLSRKLDKILNKSGRRKLRLGTYFGDTPFDANSVKSSWTKYGDGYVCPWFSCPTCSEKVIWRIADQNKGLEKLSCTSEDCSFETDEDEIVITRKSMQDRANKKPDILFLTTETLNKRLGDLWTRKLLGVGQSKDMKPRYLLLDEVHTYEGISGAQNALTLRRWRHAIGEVTQLHWVGLSATLENAESFFSSIINLDVSKVINEKLNYDADEFEEEGAEYQIILRGDPTKRASLLSTTIQSSMLIPRMLDKPGSDTQEDSLGIFGKKLFVFTDDLDNTNRLYDYILETEAYDQYRKPIPNAVPLAALRSTRAVANEVNYRDFWGQYWKSCEDIGHQLGDRLRVGRTTSSDPGVLDQANVIVATAALEVGFNDPEVGAVLQHKSPRGMAAYSQRKGRAGRTRKMRPIMVTVLSDFGRDRITFQNYERLFDPSLEAQHLPVENSYVLKIQAVYSLFDWIALQAETSGIKGNVDVWQILSEPYSDRNEITSNFIKYLKEIVFALLRCDEILVASLEKYLERSLGVKSSQIHHVMWENPRSLMLEVVPTIARRLYTNWGIAFPQNSDAVELAIKRHPVPEYIPSTLFNELSLPEVSIQVPPGDINDKAQKQPMPILQALKQFAPGRVSRRFANRRGRLSHWVPIDRDLQQQSLNVFSFAKSSEYVGAFKSNLNELDVVDEFHVYRPWSFEVHNVPHDVAIGSNSRLNWFSNLETNGTPFQLLLPKRSKWNGLITKIELYLHRHRSFVSLRRCAFSSEATIKHKNTGIQKLISVNFLDQTNRPSALGFEIEVDAICFELSRESLIGSYRSLLNTAIYKQTRYEFAKHRFMNDEALPHECNVFQREWLFQFLTVWVAQHINDLKTGSKSLEEENFSECVTELKKIIDLWFIGPVVPESASNAQDDDGLSYQLETDQNALQNALKELLDNSAICECLQRARIDLSQPSEKSISSWINDATVETLGEVFLQACINSLPENATSEDLIVDIDKSNSDSILIWVSETTLGGAGILEQLAYTISEFPNTFTDSLDAAVSVGELEKIDELLTKIIFASQVNPSLESAFRALRTPREIGERQNLWLKFTRLVSDITSEHVGRAGAISINSRLLRPGSNTKLDTVYFQILKFRDELEISLGFVIPNRELAFLSSQVEHIRDTVIDYLGDFLNSTRAETVSVIGTIEGLLWARANETRRHELQSYNPYKKEAFRDPALIRNLLKERQISEIKFNEDSAIKLVSETLQKSGAVKVSFLPSEADDFREAISQFIAQPIDVEALQFYPVIDRVEQMEHGIGAVIVLKEQIS